MYAFGANYAFVNNVKLSSNPRIQIEAITGGKGVSAAIRNLGDVNLTNVTWNITLSGGIILFGKHAQGNIKIIYRENYEIVTIPFVFGLGKTKITAAASSDQGITDQLTVNADIRGRHVTIIPGSQGALTAKLSMIARGFYSPLICTNAGDGSGRLFIGEQTGKIIILKNGTRLSTPFLDLTSKIVKISKVYDERGLLGLVFHPNYKNNGRFFVYYSAPKNGTGINHEATIAEYHVSANPNVADPSSEKIIFRVDEPEMNHNGGQLAFGPDGFLYIGLGDGGGAGDQHGTIGNGQNISVPLGKILRIDINNGTTYSVPPDNPFVGVDGLDEIYAYGFRNPFRFSFDTSTGRLFVGDVGQDMWEEVDIAEKGGNYGWRILEGNHPYDLPLATLLGINISTLKPPIFDYSHNVGHSIIGGYVYHGAQSPKLVGKYVFGDWSNSFTSAGGTLYYLEKSLNGTWQRNEFFLTAGKPLHRYIQCFGVDEQGEIYVLTTRWLGSAFPVGEVWSIEVP
jgi:glucose/arabinose dehydrogenase